MNNTPETDKTERMAYSQEYMVDTEFARKLERERDEAREKIERQANRICYLEGATNHACGTPLSVALRERDEAREAIREAWLAMDDTDGTDRMINWQNKYAHILEETK